MRTLLLWSFFGGIECWCQRFEGHLTILTLKHQLELIRQTSGGTRHSVKWLPGSREHLAADIGRIGQGLPDQRGLADSRLALDQHEPPRPAAASFTSLASVASSLSRPTSAPARRTARMGSTTRTFTDQAAFLECVLVAVMASTPEGLDGNLHKGMKLAFALAGHAPRMIPVAKNANLPCNLEALVLVPADCRKITLPMGSV
jgi:hypothetical protein